MKEIVFEWQPVTDEEGNVSTAPPVGDLSRTGTVENRAVELQYSLPVKLSEGQLACRIIARLHPTLPSRLPERVDIPADILDEMGKRGRMVDPAAYSTRKSVKLLYSGGRSRREALTVTEKYLYAIEQRRSAIL